jgi:hypothetical protein
MDIEKFKEKNEEALEELESVLNISKVRYMVISPELSVYLMEGEPKGGVWIWKEKLIVIPNPYQRAGRLDIVMENGLYSIDFMIPCVCGIYENEKHP